MDNIDFAETQKFAALATEWWDKDGKCRPLHDLNPTRLQFIIDRVSPIEGKTVIDVGCGAGILSESLAKRGAIVTGIDALPSLIQVAEQHASIELGLGSDKDTDEHNEGSDPKLNPKKSPKGSDPKINQTHFSTRLHYTVSTAEDYAKEHANTFDIVTCMELLEHVPDPLSLLTACAKLAKPGGKLFFSTLNRTMKSFFLAIVGAEYVLHLLPRGTHQYSKFIRPSELAAGLRKAELNLLEFAGLQYNPLTRQATITQDVSVNYLAHALRS